MPQASKSTSTAHQPAIATQDNTEPTTQPTHVVGTNQPAAKAEAEKRGLPHTRALDINHIDQLTPDDIVVTVRPKGDNAAGWAHLETIGCTIIPAQ